MPENIIARVLAIKDRAEMRPFFDAVVAERRATKWDEPMRSTLQDIGWAFGEGMSTELVNAWIEETGAYHPFFGACVPSKRWTPEEMLQLGVEKVESMRKKSEATR